MKPVTRMSENPKISVVMAVHNCEKYVRPAIESILNQTFQDFELIIVDDASTDQTGEIIGQLTDPRIHLLKNDVNLGQTKSLNRALQLSRGRYIARMDGDDISYLQRFQMQYDFLERQPEISVLGTWSEDIDEKGRVLRKVRPPTVPSQVKCLMAASGDLSHWCITHPTVMMRRNALEESGFYSELEDTGKGHPQDYELWSRLIRKNNFANVNQVLLKYRILPDSDSRFFWQQQIKARENVTLKQVGYFLPSLQVADALALMKMLEYQNQDSKEAGERIFSLFDQYMRVFMGSKYAQPGVQNTIRRMKLYYLPKLFVSNKLKTIQETIKIFLGNPLLTLDTKFYAKLVKVFLEETLSEDQYRRLMKTNLGYR